MIARSTSRIIVEKLGEIAVAKEKLVNETNLDKREDLIFSIKFHSTNVSKLRESIKIKK